MSKHQQLSLFDDSGAVEFPADETVGPTDPNVAAEERPRLSRQCLEVLDALRQGPKSNAQLSGIALKYSSRTSDLRQHGHDVRVIKRDHKTGYVLYGLFENGELVGKGD